ncbi:DUF748 domain-containing protein [Hydrogenophaga atypica]|uniref:DUF748 domain-containing protein n=1 Tax=Hydrogenophaga atypica TaxID=249409 RepID=A0ABW2QQF4_9BURK
MNRELLLPRLRPLWVVLLLVLTAWLLAWWAVPVWLKGVIQDQGRAALGREVRVEAVSFRPWSLELDIQGLQVAGATPDEPALLDVARLYVDAEAQSLFRLAPVVDALVVERPVLRLRHLGDGRYDIDDLLTRWAERPKSEGSVSFGLFNLALTDGELTLDDTSTGSEHRLRGLSVAVPFLSNLPTQRDVHTEPRIAFELNGSRFDTQLSTLPFAETLATRAQLHLPDLDLSPYLPYWPQNMPWRPLQARVQADLSVAFEQLQQRPVVQLSGRVALHNLKIARTAKGSAGEPLLSWEALSLVLGTSEPLARRVHVEKLSLHAPQLHLARAANGRLNLSDLLPAAGANEADPAPAPPWDVKLDGFELSNGALHWRDAAVSPAWETTVDALTLSGGPLVWPNHAPTPLVLSGRWLEASLTAKGDISPVAANLSLNWRDLPLQGLAPYVGQVLKPALAGRSAADLGLQWRAAVPASAQSSGAAPALQLQLRDLLLQDVALGPTARPLQTLRELRLQNGSIDLNARSADLGQISLSRPVVHLARDATGRWLWEDWLRSEVGQSSDAVQASTVATPWRLGWQGLRLADGSGRLDDAAAPTTVGLRWSALQLRLGAWRSDVVVDAPVSVAMRLAADGQTTNPGTLALDGRLGLTPATASAAMGGKLSAQLKLQRVPAHALAPYMADRLNLVLRQADTSWSGDLELSHNASGLAVVAKGDFTVDDLKALDANDGSPLLDWKSLHLRGLQLALAPGQAFKLSVADTALSDYFARIDIDPTGRVNLQDVVRSPPKGSSAPDPAANSAAGATAQPPAQLSFGPIALVNGNIAFSDRFVKPNYSARLSEVSGGLGAFSNHSGAGSAPAQVSLRGRVEGTGTLDIGGQLNPLLTPPVLDVVGKVRELELPPLSTYALKYTGHGIERGQLSVDVRYQVGADGQLNASNQLTLNRLAFGERAADSDAPNLPVKLAVALLADRNGVIDINLPISGSLNDPQFRLGPVIGRLILGLIGKAVTAPFALLGNLLGGPDAQPGRIDFVAGTDRLADTASPALAAIAKALNDRPALQVTVVGRSDVEGERSAFQRERLQEAVRAEKRRQAMRAGQGAETDTEVSPEAYPALLREVYRRGDFPKPRNAIGLLKDLSVAEMEALWLAHAPSSDEALRALATRRAVAVKERLVAQGLAGARVFVEVAKAGSDAAGSHADLRLSVP